MIPKLHLIAGKDDLRPIMQNIFWDGEVFCVTDSNAMILWQPPKNWDLPKEKFYIHKDQWKLLIKKQKNLHELSFEERLVYGELSCEYLNEDRFQKLYAPEEVFNPRTGKVIHEARPAKFPDWTVVWPNVVGIKEKTLDDYFKDGNISVEVSSMGINADYLSSLQKIMEGIYTKITFYGRTRGMLVECPGSLFNEKDERIIGLLMPVYTGE
jgi:hypothetical protein